MIRFATAADMGALAALRRAWVEENAGARVVDDGFEDAFTAWYAAEQQQRVTWIAEVADAAIGMLNMLVFSRMPRPGRASNHWGYLANFYVLGEYRGIGIGTELLTACTTYADDHGFVRIVLSPSERSVPLYQRDGFGPATALMLRPGPPEV
ncbi:MAG TPA: GNAT family N-acetyltransferase [Marmoricola sp.]|nr:GNAT family N-acetyltransferase [Marmoricola sp.]